MAAEVSADLTLIQDEDVLRRMWAETEDFGRKKEIRARMYKLREQRLKDFYTTGEVVTEITGRKHATTTHTESIGDQGFLTMKTKEIRDSESPTRDFNRRGNNGYWTSVEERGFTTGNQDGTTIERREESRKGEGVVVDSNTETRMALSAQNIQEKSSKSDDNMSVKSETNRQNQAFVSTSVSDTGDKSSQMETSETENSQLYRQEKTLGTVSSSTKISSSTSSSKKVVSSSVSSSSYQVTGDDNKALSEKEIKALTSIDDTSKFASNLRTNDQTNIYESSQLKSSVHRDNTDKFQLQQPLEHFISETQDFDVIKSSTQDTTQSSSQYQNKHSNQSYKTVQSYKKNYSTTSENDQKEIYDTGAENQTRTIINSRSNANQELKTNDLRNQENIRKSTSTHRKEETLETQNQIRETSDVNEFITNEKIDSSTLKRNITQSNSKAAAPSQEEHVDRYTSVREVSNDIRDSSTIHSQSNTDQKILNEIHKLDTYLINQNTPTPSAPGTPRSVTDGAQWTVVSNRDGEFVYQNDKSPRTSTPQANQSTPSQPREPMIKHPSSLDLPKDATDGQYVTTYQQSYNRISVDNSPSHEFFVRTLRASPDRLTPSPTKSSRGSLDRNSPDRRLRATSKGSLDRSSPETNKKRSFSKGSLDRSTPERANRTSPSKTPDRERRGSSDSYTIERKKDSKRKTTEITQQTVRDTTNKTKRKFSSTQQKAANKTRVSTPGVSPSTSPTRCIPKKEVTSGSESDLPQATYNKTVSVSSIRDESLTSSKTDKRYHTSDITHDNKATTNTKTSKPRDKSPEYSSEGSVSREINKSLKNRSDIKTDDNSFKPIKQKIVSDSNDTFIMEEQRNIINEITVEYNDSNKPVNVQNINRENSVVITDVTDEITDDFVPNSNDSVDNECKLLRNKATSEKVMKQNEITEQINTRKIPSSSPEHVSNDNKIPSRDNARPKSNPENKVSTTIPVSKGSCSPERKPKDLSSRQPLRQLNQKRSIDSPSATLERKPKVSSPTKSNQNVNKRPEHSPSVSPVRHQPDSKSPDRKNQKKTHDENRRSVSSSPERLHRSTHNTISKRNEETSKFISEEKRNNRERSISTSPERKPTKQIQKISPKTHEKLADKSVSRQQRPSPASSPERNVSPERKVKPSQPKRHTTPTAPKQMPKTAIPTTQQITQKTTTKETVRTTRHSSIPRANKLSPRNSKDKIEPINNKTPTQINRKATPIPKTQQVAKVTTVTRTTSKITEQKHETPKFTLTKPTNIFRRPVESSPKRSPSKITSPKLSPNKQKSSDLLSNKPSVQKITKTGSSPKIPVNKRTAQTPSKKVKNVNEIEITEVVVKEITTDNTKERSVLDLEDEHPPEEFYTEYDYKTDDTTSPDRQPKLKKTSDDISIDISKIRKTSVEQTKTKESSAKIQPKTSKSKQDTVPTKVAPSNKKPQKIQETTTRKTSRKVKKERRIPSSGKEFSSSSSSSSSEEEELEQIELLDQQNSEIIQNDQMTHASNQDLLTVVVQHPKSSRESSPGYPSANQPFCTTSEDGESNPRFADFVSEPDDVEIFDKNRGPATPIRLTEDDSVDVKSVADRVNVFLEATRVTQETVHQPEVVVSSPKSVLKAKTMFENIAKNQTSSSSQHQDLHSKPSIENNTQKYPYDQVIEYDKENTLRENNYDITIDEEINTQHGVSKSFIDEEIRSQTINDKKVLLKECPQTLKEAKPNKDQPNTRKLPEIKPMDTVVDVTSKKNLFEKKSQDKVQILEEIHNEIKEQISRELTNKETDELTYSKEYTPKCKLDKQKSPSPQRQLPKTTSKVTPDTKKPIDRKYSDTIETRKELFESTTEEIEIKEQQNKMKPKGDDAIRKHISKTEVTSRRPSLKEKSPSPQRNIPKQKEPADNKKPFERKPSGHIVDVSSKKDFFERKVKDISISASKSTPRRKEPSPQKLKLTNQSHSSPQTQTAETRVTNRHETYTKNTINNSVKAHSPERNIIHRQTNDEQEILESTRKVSYSEESKQKISKTEELIRKISETDQVNKLSKLETTSRRPLDNEQPARKTSKPEDNKRKISKPDEIVRKPSKPQEIIRTPSKSDEILKNKQIDDKSHIKTESYLRSTTSSTARGQTPENLVEERSRKPSKPEELIRRPSSRTESYMKNTITSSVRSQTPEYQPNEAIRKPSKNEPRNQDKLPSNLDELKQTDTTDDVEITESRRESYMRSTVSSSVRGQTPEKQLRESTPEGTRKNRPQSPIKSQDSRRRPSDAEEVLEDTATRRTSIRTETKQEVGGKFGVTLRKTPSSTKIMSKPTIQRQNSKPGATVDIESIFNLELLEEMLLNAVGYDDRRRIRAQIRVVKKQIEDEKNTNITTKITKTSSIQSTLPSVKDIKRQTSPSKSPERRESIQNSTRFSPERREPYSSSPRSSPERRGPASSSPRASPERHLKAGSPEKQSPERSPSRRISTEKVLTNGYRESRTVTETRTSVRTQSVRKSSSSDVKETCPTDLITSSYGVGPTDENGKPLFGLKALRRTSTNKALDENVQSEIVTEEVESTLFGLKALQTEKMPAESSQLRELVERHQQYVRENSSKELQPVQKPKAKLRDSFILNQEEDVASALSSGPDDTAKALSLKSIIQKHENNTGSNVQRSMESKSTVVKSHSTITSDGKVSLHRDVIHGEVSSKNNEEPIGKITRSSYSYQSPKDKDSVASITTSTATSLIGRRNSGPKIEEITDTCTSDTNRRYSKEYTVQEEETVVDRRRSSGLSVEENVKAYTSILKNSGNSSRRSSGPRITDVSNENSEQERRTSITRVVSSSVSPDIPETKTSLSSRQTNLKNEENRTETQKKVVTRGDSVKALQHKFQQATEAANQPTSRPYPRAGLILRSNTLQHIDDQTQMSSSMKQSSVEQTSSKSKQETKDKKTHDVPSSPVLKTEVVTQDDSAVVRSTKVSRPDEPTSFLDNTTKVTGVQDILTRMRNADLVIEKTDSTEDAEARALLNKFLGASVILQGMEQGMRATQKHSEHEGAPTSPSSAALVIQAEKQRVKATSVRTVEDDIDDINDEKQLRILLDACSDYEGRRKLRARLRTIMADQKGGPEDVEDCHGEFLGLRNIDDSGIESGEDLKGVNPDVMKEVEEALVRLECVLPGLDANRREAVSKLVTSLQSCLRLPPKRRVTIGVSPAELAAARKWLDPPLEEMIIERISFRPVLQRPGYIMEPAPQKAVVSYIPKTERSLSDSGSLQDYDPSLRLFTPEQSVQIAIHKAAIKKQISKEEKRRESSDDGDVSSGEECCEVNKYNEVSSAQRLLQIATENAKKNPSAARFHNRSSKKLKMKRANTIDIPKPANFYEYSSGDEYGASADEVNIDLERKHQSKDIKFLPPTFEPKTENDLKFLAFLKQVNENQPKMQTYNPSARGGKHWNSRFSSIKTAFEQTEQPKMSVPSPAKMFWQNSEAHQNKEYKDQYKNKLPWTVKTGDDGIVVGSLTVAKPGHVNNFNHAPKSAFKPIEKKPVSTVSGTVKQIAAQKFSVNDGEVEKRQEKVSKKQTNASQVHSNYIPNTKQNTFVNNTPSAFKKYNSFQSNSSLPEKSHSKVTSPFTNNNSSYNNKSIDATHFNDENIIINKKYNASQNKVPLSNVQKNVKPYPYNTSTQPYSNYGFVSKTQQSTLAAKKQFMQINANSISQSSPQDINYQASSHIINPTNARHQSPTSNINAQKQDYQRFNHNLTSQKSGYHIPNHNVNSQNNGYQSSKHNDNFQKNAHHMSNDIVTPQNITAKSIYNNVNDSKCRYPYNSGAFANLYSDEDDKSSPTVCLDNNNIKIEANNDISIVGDSKRKSSKDNESPESRYLDICKSDDGTFKQNNYLDPTSFENKPYTTYIYSSNNTVNSSDAFDQSSSLHHKYNEKPNYLIQTINSTPPLIKEDIAPPLSPYNLSLSNSLDNISLNKLSSTKFTEDNHYLSPSYQSVSPSLRLDDDESPWGSVTNGDDSPLEEKAVSRVMGQAQCQQAITVNNRTKRRFDIDLESELKLQIRQSAQKKSLSPSFPNVIQKSESWHQMVKEQMQQAKQAPPLPKISKAKSSHTLALPKQFEAALPLDTLTQKRQTVSQYMLKQSIATKSTKTNPKYKSTNTINIQQENDDLDDVDEVFESIFQESNKKRNKSSESSSEVVRKGDTIVKTEVHSRTTTSARLTKANSVQSPFAKFRQLERQNSAPSAGRSPPLFKFTEPKLAQSASTIKERLLSWVQAQTRHYKNIQIENFSTSWSNGLAFCALIHHFCPHAFDYDSLTPEKRRYNFELAFRVAEEEADIFPLLDVEDMVVIRKPDWKCVFTYVQSIYRRFHDSPDALPVF